MADIVVARQITCMAANVCCLVPNRDCEFDCCQGDRGRRRMLLQQCKFEFQTAVGGLFDCIPQVLPVYDTVSAALANKGYGIHSFCRALWRRRFRIQRPRRDAAVDRDGNARLALQLPGKNPSSAVGIGTG